MYKVVNKKTGKYCAGSKNGLLSFTKEGKVYNKIGHVTSMLKQFYNNEGIGYYANTTIPIEDLKIIEYEVVPRQYYEAKDIFKK